MAEPVICLLILECFCCLNNGVQDKTNGAVPGGYPMCDTGCKDIVDPSAIFKKEILFTTVGETILYFPDLTHLWPLKNDVPDTIIPRNNIKENVNNRNGTNLHFVSAIEYEGESDDFKRLRRFDRFLRSNGLKPQLYSGSHHRSKRELLSQQPVDKAIVLPDTTSDITFECATDGTLPAVAWYAFTEETGGTYKISHNGDIEATAPFGSYSVANTYDITIIDATKADAGRYVCSSLVPTEDLAIAYLTVVDPQPCANLFVPVTEGDEVSLECSADYYGAQSYDSPYVPEILWYVNNNLVTSGITVTGTNTSKPAPVSSVDGRVSSTYTFTAGNEMDMIYFDCRLFLEGDETSPQITEQNICHIKLDVTALPVIANPGPTDTYILLDGVSSTSVELECNVDTGVYGFVSWIGNSDRLTAAGNSRISVNENVVANTDPGQPTFDIETGTTFTLTIDDITEEDAGYYACQDIMTGNYLGEANVVVLNPVTCAAEILTVVPGGDDFTVDCSIEFFGAGDTSQEPIVTIELDGVEETVITDSSTTARKSISVTKSASSVVDGQVFTCNVAQESLGLNKTELCRVTVNILGITFCTTFLQIHTHIVKINTSYLKN
ncbi:unnamed protein product [Owenia fusiformis]|uniref:Uncharacterized protein n=1 Tax=Owenia fusiformis TaxID=6347 RepID=A0A8J1UKU0_OWEFU|nr:unnamed protein product [Owenia fusiformis]